MAAAAKDDEVSPDDEAQRELIGRQRRAIEERRARRAESRGSPAAGLTDCTTPPRGGSPLSPFMNTDTATASIECLRQALMQEEAHLSQRRRERAARRAGAVPKVESPDTSAHRSTTPTSIRISEIRRQLLELELGLQRRRDERDERRRRERTPRGESSPTKQFDFDRIPRDFGTPSKLGRAGCAPLERAVDSAHDTAWPPWLCGCFG